MGLFSDILLETITLLHESKVTNDMVNQAMDERRRVIISYHSNGEDNNTGPRLIEIYAYGVTTAGNPVIRAFQPFGDTTTKIPNWKYFLLSRISSWKETGQVYDTLPEDRYPGVGNFNPNDDKTMAYVYKIVSFDGNHAKVANDTIPTGPKTQADMSNNNPVYKTDTEKGIEKLRKQLDKPITLDDLIGKKNVEPQVDKGETTPTPTTHGPKTKDEISKPEVNTSQDTSQPNNDNNQQSNTMSYPEFTKRLRDGEDLFKTDTERKIDNLRKQLDNPRKIDLSNIPKR